MMRRYITVAWMFFMLAAFALSGCGADVDLILDNGQSAAAEDATPEDEAVAENDAGDALTASADAGDTGAAPVEEESADAICAYICGAVESPGVYEAEAGVRVYALVEMAGGLTDEADKESVNLARTVADGEMIYIPTEEETASGEVLPEAAGTVSADAGGTGQTSDKININTASADELTALSGIGDAKAAAIVSYREEHGSFASTEEITNVSGIGDSTYEKIKDYITV